MDITNTLHVQRCKLQNVQTHPHCTVCKKPFTEGRTILYIEIRYPSNRAKSYYCCCGPRCVNMQILAMGDDWRAPF